MSAAEELAAVAQLLETRGLNAGTSGNVSVRLPDGLLVTPSAVPSEHMHAEAMVALGWDGEVLSAGIPTTEWRIHSDIYRAFPDAGAIVHTHSTYATALASLREDLPAFHYQVAKAGGYTVACAQYAPYGTQELSDAVIVALGTRRACLMANHGLVAYAPDLEKALALAVEVETLCQQYLIARSAGQPVLLSDEEMDVVLDQFSRYGKDSPDTA